MRGRAALLPVAIIAVVVLLGTAVTAMVAWRTSSLAELEARLHEQDPFAEFVERPAPAFALTDSKGESVRLDNFRGRAVVLNFIYARCRDICPPHMALLADLQARIDQAGLSKRVALVTLATDTEKARATAKIIHDYGDRYGLESSNWHMLYRGDRPARTVIDLAAEYGLEFRVVTSADTHAHAHTSAPVERQVHGAVFHVIDPAGRMRARFHGLRFQPRTLITYLKALTETGAAS